MDAKKQLRLKFRQWMKESVTPEHSLSSGKSILHSIQQKFTALDSLSVSIFISKFPEISTAPLIDHLYSIGAKVYIPAWNSKEMWMCQVEGKEDFEAMIRDAPEDKIPMPHTNTIPIQSVVYDFIIMPGLVFDGKCHRLGYGYGHYDYFLSKYFEANPEAKSKTKLIGVGYDEQILEGFLPFEEHDIQLHEVITPTKRIVQ